MASLRRFLKSLAGRKGKASRGGTPGSHVNKRANKRAANKAVRRCPICDGTCYDSTDPDINQEDRS